MAKFCRNCGNPLNEGAKFCRRCGAQLTMQVQTETQPVLQEEAVHDPHPSADADTFSQALIPYAPASAGMSSFDIGVPGIAGGINGIGEILSPIQTVGSYFGRIAGGIKNFGKNPMALIPVIALSLVWILLFILRRVGIADNIVARFLSWASFGWSTSGRALPGVLGSILGRASVAFCFSSLITGGISFIISGFKRISGKEGFTDEESQGSVSDPIKNMISGSSMGWLLLGAGAGLILNRFIAGSPSFSNVMAMISMALMSVMAFANRGSFIFSLARAVTSRVVNKNKRTADNASLRAVMTGFTAALSLMVLFSAFNSLFGLIFKKAGLLRFFISALPFIGGVVLLIVGIVLVSMKKQNPSESSSVGRR